MVLGEKGVFFQKADRGSGLVSYTSKLAEFRADLLVESKVFD